MNNVFSLVLFSICFLMAWIAAIIAVYTYNSNKKMIASNNLDFSKVFATKLCNKYIINCDINDFKNHHSFEDLIDNDIFVSNNTKA